MASRKVCSFFVVAALALTSRAHADQIVYQNTTTPGGSYVFNGAASVSDDLTGNIDINELTLAAGSEDESITSLSVQILNDNSFAVSVRPVIYIWADNGVGGLPGTLLGAFAPISIELSGLGTFTVEVNSFSIENSLVVPADRELWAGLGYDNDYGAFTPVLAKHPNRPLWSFRRLYRPISARFYAAGSLRASARILVNRLENRPRCLRT